MGIEHVRREMDVRVVRCDRSGSSWADELQCVATTAEFLPDVTDVQGGPVLLDASWLQLRTGGVRTWYFCSVEHLAEWVNGPGLQVLGTGAQPLGTVKTRRET